MIINEKRELAYISKITDLQPIPNYDRVELATINDGWRVIVSKNDNFKIGDLCVYFEVDSKVPNNDERFKFLEKRHYKIKTIKMCGVISQGLVMSLNLFPEITTHELFYPLTDLLKVTYSVDEDNVRKASVDPNAKYKRMSSRHQKLAKTFWWRWLYRKNWGKKLLFIFFGKKKESNLGFPKHFPFIHKTDEERVENMPWVLGYEHPLIVTEKLDGTSSTYILERKKRNKFEFYVLSRNVRQLNENQKTYHESNIYWENAYKYDIENKLKSYLLEHPDESYVCIQGESVGNVQGNPLHLIDNDLYVFNFITSTRGLLNPIEGSIEAELLGFKWVPILDDNYLMPTDMEEFKLYADGNSLVNPEVLREGVVLRDINSTLSFKNVSRKYLLNEK